MQFLEDINTLIKENKPVTLVQNTPVSNDNVITALNEGYAINEDSPGDDPTFVVEHDETTEDLKRDSSHPWSYLHLPVAPKKEDVRNKTLGTSVPKKKLEPKGFQEEYENEEEAINGALEETSTKATIEIEETIVEKAAPSLFHSIGAEPTEVMELAMIQTASSSPLPTTSLEVITVEMPKLSTCAPKRSRFRPMLFLDKIEPLTKTNKLCS
ncbi:hypothetical protein OUZ56_010687 [Daphnia magna]|uniref:Uncharacterized protein n=1 Tax=Daphnia magna TaxID=35525 RepID=A0ABQ9YYB3_9CRUS|nr:hypothetical protein OUZ56_010687 [Daphnia magna]